MLESDEEVSDISPVTLGEGVTVGLFVVVGNTGVAVVIAEDPGFVDDENDGVVNVDIAAEVDNVGVVNLGQVFWLVFGNSPTDNWNNFQDTLIILLNRLGFRN